MVKAKNSSYLRPSGRHFLNQSPTNSATDPFFHTMKLGIIAECSACRWLLHLQPHRPITQHFGDGAFCQYTSLGAKVCSKMEVFISVNGQRLGPYSLEQVADMNRLGSFGRDGLAWSEGQADWQPIGAFLFAHGVRSVPRAKLRQKEPSTLRGLAGAFVGGIAGGAIRSAALGGGVGS